MCIAHGQQLHAPFSSCLKTACHPLAHTAPCFCVQVSSTSARGVPTPHHVVSPTAPTVPSHSRSLAMAGRLRTQDAPPWPPYAHSPSLPLSPWGTTLIITPLPHPPSCKFALRSGTTLFTVKYHAASPKAVIVFVHGFTDHAQRHISGTWLKVCRKKRQGGDGEGRMVQGC